MKAFSKLLYAAALIAASLTGCKQELDAPEPGRAIHFKINASPLDTKTGIMYDSGTYIPYWNSGDQLGVLFTLPSEAANLSNDATFSNTQSKGDDAVFEGDVILGNGNNVTFYSYYPASSGAKSYYDAGVTTLGLDVPATQSPVYDGTFGYSFDPSADILIAQPTTCSIDGGVATNEVDMYFARLTSVFRIALNAANSTEFYGEVVKSFTIEVSSGDIAGRIVVNPITGEYIKTNNVTGSKSITANYDTNACPVYVGYDGTNNVFLSVAPITIPSGSSLTFTINTVNPLTGEDSHTLVKTVSSSPEIPFDSSKPTVITLTLTDENISDTSIEYTLVKNISELTVDSEVIIAALNENYAMGSQASNNRTGVSQEKANGGLKISGPGPSVQLLTIKEGSEDNTIAFYTGSGYLFAASSSSNYLRTEGELSANSSWSVAIDSGTGAATMVAQGTNSRNTLQYNSSSHIFAAYSSASQSAVAIYKRSTPDTRTDVTLSFANASYSLSVGSAEYTSFTGQTVTTTPGGVTGVTYALTGDPIGEVDSGTGAISLNDTEGTATVTASFVGDKNYKPATPVSYTITVDDPNIVDYVTLDWTYPENGDATSTGISAITGVAVSGLGSDYAESHSPYRIKFDNTDDYIIVKTNAAISDVSVSYKMIGGGTTSTLNILESSDGSSFTLVQDLSIAGSQNSTGIVTTSNDFSTESRYVKINFTKGANVGIGGITITGRTPRFTVVSPLQASAAGDDYEVSITRKYFDGVINVAVPGDCSWITADNVAAGNNKLTVHVAANTGAARSANLTLSGEGVANQILVINQEELVVPPTIADVISGGANSYEVPNVLVYAVKGNGMILGDATARIYAYKSEHGLSIGDVRDVNGSTQLYNEEVYQFSDPTFTGSGTSAINHGAYIDFNAEADNIQTSFTDAGNIHSAIYVHATGVQSGRNITTSGGKTLYLSASEAETDGKAVEVYGYVYAYSSSHTNFYFLVTSIEVDQSVPSLSTTPASGTILSWADDEFGVDKAKTISVTLNGDATGYTVSSGNAAWTISDNGSGSITVYPNAANTSTTDDKTLDITITHNDNALLTSSITLKQNKQTGGGATPQTVFLEDFGSTSSNTAFASYDGYSATTSMFSTSGTVKSHYSGSGSVGKNNLAAANLSNGYAGASGLSGCYHGGTANTEATIIQISNIDINGCTNLSLSFGALGGSSSHKINVSYTIDGGAEKSLISNGSITNSGWTLLSEDIPDTGSSLTLIFKHKPTKAWTIRIDDIKVVGTK